MNSPYSSQRVSRRTAAELKYHIYCAAIIAGSQPGMQWHKVTPVYKAMVLDLWEQQRVAKRYRHIERTAARFFVFPGDLPP